MNEDMQSEFITIISENKGIIYKITKLYADQHSDQQDLYQEIVYQLWKSFDSFNNKSKISTWIYRVALNTSLMHLNQKKKSPKRTSIENVFLHVEDKEDNLMEERTALLYRRIKELNEGERGIILLYLEGKSYEEISAITGFSVSNVGTKLGRIKLKLKTQIIK